MASQYPSVSLPRWLDPIKKVYQESLKWIMPYAPTATHAAAVCGVPALHIRMQGLAASFVVHIQRMDVEHPARRIISRTAQCKGRNGDGLILPKAAKNAVHDKIARACQETTISFKDALRKWYLDQLNAGSITARYITRSSRSKFLGEDLTLRWTDGELRTKALKWRTGSYGRPNLYKCPKGHTFGRACPVRCNLPIQANVRPQLQQTRTPDPAPEYFCIIDLVLNCQDQNLFAEAIRSLEELLL